MTRSRYIVGIDLGTTNCAVAYVDTKGRERPAADIRMFDVPQLVAAGRDGPPDRCCRRSSTLPAAQSCRPGRARLPWNDGGGPDRRRVRPDPGSRGAQPPGQQRQELALPPGRGPRGRHPALGQRRPRSRKVSPVEASADYLRHIRDAWNDTLRPGRSGAAARAAGGRAHRPRLVRRGRSRADARGREEGRTWPRLTLLEEPQAAFYCWIVSHQDRWQREVRAGELILVCDIGGGTTDFSLITVVETPTGPGFRRVAVGDHLMLGGDNIDLALAHQVEKKLGGRPARHRAVERTAVCLPDGQGKAARRAAAAARALAGDDRRPGLADHRRQHPVGADARRGRVDRARRLLPHGPRAATSPQRGGRSWASRSSACRSSPIRPCPSTSSAFLRRHRAEAIGQGGHQRRRPARPARRHPLQRRRPHARQSCASRIVEVVGFVVRRRSRPGLRAPGADQRLARPGRGPRGGLLRRRPPGRRHPDRRRDGAIVLRRASRPETAAKPWLCVVPRDAQEGDEITIDGHDFDLLMGQPVAFPLASSSVRPDDRPGDLVRGRSRLDPRAAAASEPDARRPQGEGRACARAAWRRGSPRSARSSSGASRGPTTAAGGSRSSFAARPEPAGARPRSPARRPTGWSSSSPSSTRPSPRSVTAFERRLRGRRRGRARPTDQAARRAARRPPRPVAAVGTAGLLGAAPRPGRPTGSRARGTSRAGSTSPGSALRPGRGFPLDEIRIKALWPIFHQGVKHTKDVQCWAEWWILWRRVAAGLSRQHHDEISPPARAVPASREGSQPVQEGRPAQARAARAGRDVAVRRQPRAACARVEGEPGRAAAQGAVAAPPRLVTPSGAWDGSGRACPFTVWPTRSSAVMWSSGGSTFC